jgi:hypothetical protein
MVLARFPGGDSPKEKWLIEIGKDRRAPNPILSTNPVHSILDKLIDYTVPRGLVLHAGLLRLLVPLLPLLYLPCLAFDFALLHPRNIGDDLARGTLVRVHIGHFHDLPVLVRSTIVDPINPALV